ncbi:LysR family transcriptional regulator [Roseomonas sp. PWR1]|uniref:LysR family transcriptional regulator n=1 Tax=Roseomonas nitratireducens TaxID=2820810 RepID=A0ABS4ASU0_9PROT|nr:LysR substrate-binding domain-containing protein [Neoroseomonas nitratireducens]MBP0464415.1 LysR family transcriptional regulator [Neoroseomonas nitratireducens]
MDLRQLRTFREIAEAGSLSRAADRLRIAQPALSRQIRLLEAEAGLALFTRHGRGMDLTEAGRELLARVAGPMRQLERAVVEVRALAGTVAGQVALGMMPTVAAVLAGPLARRVAARHPEVSLRVVEGYTGHLVEWLQRGATDATLLYGPATDFHLPVEPLFAEPLVLVGPPGSGLRAEVPVTLADAARHPLVLPSRPHGLRAIVEAAAGRARLALSLRHEADSFLVLKDLVECGLGFAILPRSAIRREEAEGRLLVAPIHRPVVRRQVVLARPPDRSPGRATRAVLDLLLEEVRARAHDGAWQVSTEGR